MAADGAVGMVETPAESVEEIMSVANAGTDFVTRRVAELSAIDPQFRAAIPDPAVDQAKLDPMLGFAQIVDRIMTGYRDRPAVGDRAMELAVEPETGRTVRRLLDRYDTVSYGELWSRARALATFWHRNEARPLRANDMVCILGFAGGEFVTVDLAAIHAGIVSVPLQTNAALATLQGIMNEIEPGWVAASQENLAMAVELALTSHRPRGILVFDYRPEVDDERERFDAARTRLAEAGLPDMLISLDDACAAGAAMEPAPLFAEAGTEKRLCTIYYTSGSTGLPKGVMYSESLLKPTLRMMSSIPFIFLHYMPMNHAMGRSGVFTTLNTGGTCYFAAKSDLSTLFDDIRLVRPTFLGVVTRICEMIYQQYQVELERRAPDAPDPEALKRELIREVRDTVLGGRMLSCNFGSAPIAPELRAFMETCLNFRMDEYFGITEVSAVLRDQRILRPPVIAYKLVDVPELGYFTTDKPHPRGEMLIKSHNVMLGYYKRPEATAAAFDEDGFYRTGDIMAEVEPEHLVYVDRRNNVQKLSQGEFVAISRLETLFNNGHPLIRQSFLHGTSERSFLLGVFVPNPDTVRLMGIDGDAAAIKAALREAIRQVARAEKLNAYEVPRDFIVEYEPFTVENGMLAGAGKYARPNLKARYVPTLEQLYDEIAAAQSDELQTLRREGRDAPVIDTVARAVQATLGIERIDPSKPASFPELGGDSLSALGCSLLLEEIYGVEVPSSVINSPAGGLAELAGYIERALSGGARPTFASVHGRGATSIRAIDLRLDKFIDPDTLRNAARAAPPSDTVRTVLVTGATGYLGRFLCLEWLEHMAGTGGKVICIARGRDAATARQRIADVFDSGDPELKRHFAQLADGHLEVLAGDLGERDMGLDPAEWRRLAEQVDVIVHPAALVNHVLPYAQMFDPNVAGTAELIRLALTHRLKPIHNVSTQMVAVLPDGSTIDEDADVRAATPQRALDPDAYADGYNHSKWAGEVLLREAHERFGLPVAVFRSDMIMAHSRYRGQINAPDLLTRILASTIMTGIAPRSFHAAGPAEPHFDGLPVDFIARAITAVGSASPEGYRTYHVVNPHQDGVSLDSFVEWMIEDGAAIARIDDYGEWYGRFETALRALPEDKRRHSSLPLLHMLREPMGNAAGATIPCDRFRAAVRAHGIAGHGDDIPGIDRALIRKYADDIRALELV